ncbi:MULTISPECIES: extracellular solute-binding protein [Kitasatospora]|uniref:Putative ABC transporter substrate-binding protein n=1 Tax=Kitasatospora setae (strain ATCC 33774 / DSM 43861 / JCM 3304 / KCC A-0304 / NBRC 14216 / KM-6054) TaxID=452652 RepID=E4NFN7_KITSK|nr:extracellular solute-binding protein [Kitasatospora setae]BAJ30317.1 putative ABC transporter substrate-binding protein [Kitasatospora setae KM-6054]
MPIRRRQVLLGGLAALGGTALARYGSAEASSTDGPAGLLEVATGWTAGPEQNGLQAMLAALKGRAPDVTFVSGDRSNPTGTDLAARLADGPPPDSFRCSGGAELADLAPHLEPLDALARAHRWTAGLPAPLLPRLRAQGALYAVPAGARRTNLLWTNQRLLADAGAALPAADPGALLARLRRVAATGTVPLAVGGPTEVLQLAETALLAAHGPDGFAALWQPGGPWSARATTDALRTLDDLLALAAPPAADADWTDAAHLLGTGRAGWLLTGDWADSWLRDTLDLRPGTDYGWAAAPGTGDLFQARVDAFALPRGARHRAAALAWLDVCAGLDGQVALNGARAAVPARTDLPEPTRALFGPYARWSLDEWRGRRPVDSLTHGGLLTARRRQAAQAAARAFTAHRDSTRLARDLAAL